MVSLKKNLAVLIIVFSFALTAGKAAAAISCCKNGKLSTCPDLPNGQQYDISSCTSVSPVDPLIPGGQLADEKYEALECLSGQVQYRTKDECGTSSRKCCSDGKWSGWDEECSSSGASSCTSSQCWNGGECEDRESIRAACSLYIPHTVSGTIVRTAECVSGQGWSYGEWQGVGDGCICAEGYSPDEGSLLTCHKTEYYWKIISTETPNVNPYTQVNCEDAAYSDTYLVKNYYGISDSEYIFDADCKSYCDKYSNYSHKFNIWRGGTCYRFMLECVKS